MLQFRSNMLWKYFCTKYLCLRVKDNHMKILQASKYVKVFQLDRAKPREVKDNSYKLSATNGELSSRLYRNLLFRKPPHHVTVGFIEGDYLRTLWKTPQYQSYNVQYNVQPYCLVLVTAEIICRIIWQVQANKYVIFLLF